MPSSTTTPTWPSITRRLGDLGRAEALLQDGLRVRPGSPSTLYALGSRRLHAGDTASAIAYLGQAVQLDPTFQDSWYVLGVAYERAGDVENAKRCYWRQLHCTPGHQAASLHLRRLLAMPRPGTPPGQVR